MTDNPTPNDIALLPCPLCKRVPRRNGRGGTGGVLCTGDNKTVGEIHRFQTYGADQAEADAAWNRAAALAPGQHDGAAGDVSDLLGRLADDAALSRERSVACRKIGDQRGWSIASQICDDIDEAVHVIRYLSARDGAAGEGCVGCEGKPAPENNPCAVCGAYTPKPSTEQARAEGVQTYAVDDRGLFCRHCGRASWLHHRVIGAGNFCVAPDATPSSDDGARR